MKCDKWFHMYSDEKGLKLICDEVADVRENVKGEWIVKKDIINCSVCKRCSWSKSHEDLVRSFNFCPNCGARMEGE